MGAYWGRVYRRDLDYLWQEELLQTAVLEGHVHISLLGLEKVDLALPAILATEVQTTVSFLSGSRVVCCLLLWKEVLLLGSVGSVVFLVGFGRWVYI